MVMAIRQFERLFREAASLDIDKSDLKRLEEFIALRLHDLLVRGQASAKMNGRDLIEYADLPITAGLQENIQEFRKLDETLNLSPILDKLSGQPLLDLDYAESTLERIPEITGGMTISLAKVFCVLDERLKNPGSDEWEKVEQIYRILL